MEAHCIEMDPELVLTRYGKICRHGNDCREGRSLYLLIPRNRRQGCHAGPQGESTGVSKKAEEEKEEHGSEPLLGFSGDGMDKAG